MHRHLLPSTVALALAAAGCGSARMIRRDPQGGTVEVSGSNMAAYEDANVLMATRCHGPFSVEEEDGSLGAGPSPHQKRFDFLCTERVDTPVAPDLRARRSD